MHGRDLLKEYLGKAIGNGQTTRVWQDDWISLSDNIKPYGPVQEEYLDFTVSDLLTDDLQWNTKRVKEVLPLLADKILCLKPSQTGAEDIFIWKPTTTGVYTTKSGYVAASLERETKSIRDEEEFDWIRDVWTSRCSPKMKVFL